jgi:hypothetical protein
MQKNAIAIGTSVLEFVNILLSYYPRGLSENFDVYFFVDTKKISIDAVKEVVSKHSIPVFDNATYVDVQKLYAYYVKKHQYDETAEKFLYQHGALYKILMPIFLKEKYGVEKVYTSDDDVLILQDISYLFNKFPHYAYKKENLFGLRNKDKYEVISAFNAIFESAFTLEELNTLSLNSGNIMYTYEPKLEYYFERYMKSAFVHHLYFDFEGYTSWTVEQRFHHFNIHRLLNERTPVAFFEGIDLRLISCVGKNPPERYLKDVVPAVIHYAIGRKKLQFLNVFLPGLEWRYNFRYAAQYELKDLLYKEGRAPSILRL